MRHVQRAAEHRRVRAGRPAAPRDPRADRARPDQGRRSRTSSRRRYGPAVLALPDDEGFSLAVWLVPIARRARLLGDARAAAAPLARAPARRRGDGTGTAGPELSRRRRAPPRPGPRALRRCDARRRRAEADTTVIAAFAVGLVSFVSPCVLPLVPGYLSAVSGRGHRRDPLGRAPPLEHHAGPRRSSACRSRSCSSRWA